MKSFDYLKICNYPEHVLSPACRTDTLNILLLYRNSLAVMRSYEIMTAEGDTKTIKYIIISTH